MAYKESESYIATPPGEFLKELMSTQDISAREISALLDMPLSDFYNLLEGDSPLTKEIADALGERFSFTPEFWMNWERGYRKDLEEVNRENACLMLQPA